MKCDAIIKLFTKITQYFSIIADTKKPVVSIGGDHSITGGILQGLCNNESKLINSKNIVENQSVDKEFNSFPSNLNYNLNDIKDNLMDALNKSILEENYEVAAKIRDRIKSIEETKQD